MLADGAETPAETRGDRGDRSGQPELLGPVLSRALTALAARHEITGRPDLRRDAARRRDLGGGARAASPTATCGSASPSARMGSS